VQRTGRLVVVHEAPLSLGFGAELAATVQERAFGYLHCPIGRVAAPDLPYGFSGGDEYYRPNKARIAAAIRRAMEFDF
jgi:pyruvate/2-oxoglutarate/acetoin dehydrogenase E1 component